MKQIVIPVLTGKSAKHFIKKADYNLNKTTKTDFSRQIDSMRSILLKSKLGVCPTEYK